MFINKSFEKLSRTTRYRLQKVLLSPDITDDEDTEHDHKESLDEYDREPTDNYNFDRSSESEYFGDLEDDDNSIYDNMNDNHINDFNIKTDKLSSNSSEYSIDGDDNESQSIDSSSDEEYDNCNGSFEDNQSYSSESEESDESSDSSQSDPTFGTDHLNNPLYDNAPLTLAGIWFGEKPQPNLFLNSFRNDLIKIYNGIWCKTTDLNRRIKVRGKIICGTCDLPAKANFLNIKGHNGIFGCCHCKIQSKYFNRRRIYPFKPNPSLRTTRESIDDGRKAAKSQSAVHGICLTDRKTFNRNLYEELRLRA
ncbi:hypothetical protein KQX54_007105 [Cotesia glomerata]|uniref:Uncharacterized protein n=1 Tax=Cotesia glomerata TaxID=32391 RepID=A0AAV7HS70_COTGL|nr:hypothetical protein KQX54_007105 [Cotesia glomerata]